MQKLENILKYETYCNYFIVSHNSTNFKQTKPSNKILLFQN